MIAQFMVPKIPAEAASNPVIVSPAERSLINLNSSYITIDWDAPSGDVNHYIVNVRELSSSDIEETELVYTNRTVPPSRTYFNGSPSDFNGYLYRASVCAVMTNGSKKWSNERCFFVSCHNTRLYDAPFSFYISNTFDLASKNAMYYAAQTWNNASGLSYELVNTYPFNQWNHQNIVNLDDNYSCIVENGDPDEMDYAMCTFYRYDHTTFELEKVDICVNSLDIDWGNGLGNFRDIQSSMTHEFGHVLGLPDAYESFSETWTMHGYGTNNDISRRSLETADINFLTQLY